MTDKNVITIDSTYQFVQSVETKMHKHPTSFKRNVNQRVNVWTKRNVNCVPKEMDTYNITDNANPFFGSKKNQIHCNKNNKYLYQNKIVKNYKSYSNHQRKYQYHRW